MRFTGTFDDSLAARQSTRPRAVRTSRAAKRVTEILSAAGISVNGHRPWDLEVHNDGFFQRALSEGSIGVGESYMDGWWDVEALDEFFTRVQAADLYKKVGRLSDLWFAFRGTLLNLQTKARSKQVAQQHYDLGNRFYRAMLGRTMQYTCAYWPGVKTLDEAQENKLRLICRKLYLSPGMTVLELGGGFGELARFLAANYGCHVVSYNISKEQVAYGREICRGLPVRFEEKDYREAAGEQMSFDRVVSIGLCEHIGYKNYRSFFQLANDRLKDHGLFLVHTIGGNQSFAYTDPWLNKYIFPNGMLPSIAQLGKGAEGLFVVEDWHNFGPDYDKTLLAWWSNLERDWPTLRADYGERFHRMWKYYLMATAGGFRARKLQLWQVALSKGDIPFYTPVR